MEIQTVVVLDKKLLIFIPQIGWLWNTKWRNWDYLPWGSSHQNGADDGFACDNFNNYFLVKLFLVKVMYYGVLNYKIKNKPNIGAIF